MKNLSEMLASLDPSEKDFAVQAIDLLLPGAIERDASDIHLHPREGGWEVLLRIDGVLAKLGWIRGGCPFGEV